jgi:ribosomal-protein-alanine N-acetyltransferase
VSRQITPLPSGSAAPLSLLHAACFPEDPWDAAALERILGLSGVFGYVACEDDSAAGFILLRDLGGEAEILSIGVLPEQRRRGLGCALLDAAVAQAGPCGIGSIVLEVAADNDAARQLYAASGFVQVGRRPRYYRRPDGTADALILRLRVRRDITGDAARR